VDRDGQVTTSCHGKDGRDWSCGAITNDGFWERRRRAEERTLALTRTKGKSWKKRKKKRSKGVLELVDESEGRGAGYTKRMR